MQLIIKTSCGHTFVSSRSLDQNAERPLLLGATFDCPECGRLEVLDELKVTVESTSFHQMMHDRYEARGAEFVWPADGVGTGYVEFA